MTMLQIYSITVKRRCHQPRHPSLDGSSPYVWYILKVAGQVVMIRLQHCN